MYSYSCKYRNLRKNKNFVPLKFTKMKFNFDNFYFAL